MSGQEAVAAAAAFGSAPLKIKKCAGIVNKWWYFNNAIKLNEALQNFKNIYFENIYIWEIYLNFLFFLDSKKNGINPGSSRGKQST